MSTTPGFCGALRAALLVPAGLLFAAGCIDSIGGSSAPPGSSLNGDLLPLDAEPRVDLPGRVSVFFQVLGPAGTGVAGLEGGEFELLEDGEPVSLSESKQRLLARPRVFRSYSLLLLDRSGSIVGSPSSAQEQIEAARVYIELVSQSPESFIALAWFDGSNDIRPLLLDDFTELGFSNDREKLLEAIDNLHDQPPSSTSTNLNGAVLRGLADLDEIDADALAQGIEFRSLTLVTFTDGSDQAGTTAMEEVQERLGEIEESGRRRYRAFTIGLGSEINVQALGELGPDGTVFAQGIGDLTPQFELIAQAVADVANSFYFLSYCSPKQDGSGLHSLTVRVRTQGVVAEEVYEFSADYFSGGCGFVDFFTPVQQRGAIVVGDMAVDAEGRVLIVGSHRSAGAITEELSLVRVEADGSADESFGALGRVRLSQTGTFTSLRGTGVVVDGDGTIVVGGIAGAGELDASLTRAALWRFDASGTLIDSAIVPAASSDGDALNDLELDSAGRIVAVGRAGVQESRTAVWRFGPELQADLEFNLPQGFLLHEAVPGAPGTASRRWPWLSRETTRSPSPVALARRSSPRRISRSCASCRPARSTRASRGARCAATPSRGSSPERPGTSPSTPRGTWWSAGPTPSPVGPSGPRCGASGPTARPTPRSRAAPSRASSAPASWPCPTSSSSSSASSSAMWRTYARSPSRATTRSWLMECAATRPSMRTYRPGASAPTVFSSGRTTAPAS